MTLSEVAGEMHLAVRCCNDRLDREVAGAYAGDLMSDVIAHALPGTVWITMQVHVNIVAVAVLKELAGIILVQGREPAEDTAARAEAEHIPVLSTELPAYETAGRLHALLGRGP